MPAVTYYVALPVDRNDAGDLVAGEAQKCQTIRAAIRRVLCGYSRLFDRRPGTGEFEQAAVLKQFGDAPAEDALMGYE